MFQFAGRWRSVSLAIVLVLLLSSAAAVGDDGRSAQSTTTRPAATSNFFADRVQTVSSSRVLIGYGVMSGREPVTQVELWYTRDRGRAWLKANVPESLENPIAFDAPADGVYGFYLVLHNARSATPPPAPGVAAHQWIRVDRTAPLVQILSLAADERFDLNRELTIRWSAADASFADRPVSLHYRTEQTRMFVPMVGDLPAEGSYRWTVPEGVSGRLEVKVSAEDRAGHRGQQVADWLKVQDGRVVRTATWQAAQGKVPREPPARDASEVVGVLGRERIHSEPDAGRREDRSEAAMEAKRLYDVATWERLRGERDVALSRYRQALRRYPRFLAARSDLAGLLVLGGELKAAEGEFRRVLEQDSTYRPAIKGLALVQARRGEYRSAHQTLQKLLVISPQDAEAWLDFGDVCMFMGDRSAAREAWAKASSLAEASSDLKKRASRRLEIYRVDHADGGRTVLSEP